jgi:hypothetical protein
MVVLESYSHPKVDPQTGQIFSDDYFILKCSNCANIHDDFSFTKYLYLYITVKHLEHVSEKQIDYDIDGSFPDKIENDILIQLARIQVYLQKYKYKEAICTIDKLFSPIFDVDNMLDNEKRLKLYKLTFLFLSGQGADYNKLRNELTKDFSTAENDLEFIYDMLILLNKTNHNVDVSLYNNFREKYFPSYIPSVNIDSPFRKTLTEAIIDSDDIPKIKDEIFKSILFSNISINIIEILFEILIRNNIQWDKWPNDEIIFLEYLSKATIPKITYRKKYSAE